MELFGKEIRLRERGCGSLGTVEPYVNLFVKVTDACRAKCPFCSNAAARGAVQGFDMEKLFRIIAEIENQGINLHRLNVTGGEPSLVPGLVEELLNRLSVGDFRYIHTHFNTNGIMEESRALMQHPRWDSVSLSLHHYSAERMAELYGCPVPLEKMLASAAACSKLNASCNLIRGYIDSPGGAREMIRMCVEHGVARLGFVSLMPVNAYSLSHYVGFEELHLEDLAHVWQTRVRRRGEDCRCGNYLYHRDGAILEIYARHYMNPFAAESSLVYDGAHLRQGFGNGLVIC